MSGEIEGLRQIRANLLEINSGLLKERDKARKQVTTLREILETDAQEIGEARATIDTLRAQLAAVTAERELLASALGSGELLAVAFLPGPLAHLLAWQQARGLERADALDFSIQQMEAILRGIGSMQAERDALRTENERLRGHLEEIRSGDHPDPVACPDCAECRIDAALAGKGERG